MSCYTELSFANFRKTFWSNGRFELFSYNPSPLWLEDPQHQTQRCTMAAAGRLTTHVLDTSTGAPAANMSISLFRISGSDRELLATMRTNGDGRCDAPLLSGPAMVEGYYELVFGYGEYLQRTSITFGEALFLQEIPVRFQISDTSLHYHIPLLVAPFGYSTYRGS